MGGCLSATEYAKKHDISIDPLVDPLELLLDGFSRENSYHSRNHISKDVRTEMRKFAACFYTYTGPYDSGLGHNINPFDPKRDILIKDSQSVDKIDWKRRASIAYNKQENELTIVCYANIKIKYDPLYEGNLHLAELCIPKVPAVDRVNLVVPGLICIEDSDNLIAEVKQLHIDCHTLDIKENACVGTTTTESPPTLTIHAEHFKHYGKIGAWMKDPKPDPEAEPDQEPKPKPEPGFIKVKYQKLESASNVRFLVQKTHGIRGAHGTFDLSNLIQSPETPTNVVRGEKDGRWRCLEIQENDKVKTT